MPDQKPPNKILVNVALFLAGCIVGKLFLRLAGGN
jgi:flagellar biosynthesis protein FliP